MKRSKAYRAAEEKIDDAQLYTAEEALTLVKGNASAKFDETVEVAMRLVGRRLRDRPRCARGR